MKLLKGKNILITGASRGIGNGIAVTLASHGANIFYTLILKIVQMLWKKKFKNMVLRSDLISRMPQVLTNLTSL